MVWWWSLQRNSLYFRMTFQYLFSVSKERSRFDLSRMASNANTMINEREKRSVLGYLTCFLNALLIVFLTIPLSCPFIDFPSIFHNLHWRPFNHFRKMDLLSDKSRGILGFYEFLSLSSSVFHIDELIVSSLIIELEWHDSYWRGNSSSWGLYRASVW